ncbi:MAG: hypothetical protein WC854_09520 [Bacteroidales bacterium]
MKKVKVIALKSREIAFTDSVGWFVVQSFKKDVLTVSASGFREKKIRLGKQNRYTIDLFFVDNVTNFNDAINNGHISEATLKQAINSNQLRNGKNYSKYNSIYELIGSEIYDVSVKGTSVYNKAVRSFDSNPQVLYVVDDKIVSDISYVNPTYVKTIEFIDDVGAVMYGSKGANGVIKIGLK